MRYVILIAVVTLLGCNRGSGFNNAAPASASSSRHVVKPDTRPAFVLDPKKPFVIELGRGGASDGLDIVKINETGTVEMTRMLGKPIEESAKLQLSRTEVSKLVDIINSQQITRMGRSYSDPDIADGSQWILWIEQSPGEKSIFFNNSFPPQLMIFVNELDALLKKAGEESVTWSPAPQPQAAEQHQMLSGRIRTVDSKEMNTSR